MDIMDRTRALPQELQDVIFPYVHLPDTSPYYQDSRRDETPRYHTVPVPRTKVTLSDLVSLMTSILKANEAYDLDWAQATLCIVRLFQMYDLFKLIPDDFFRPHLGRYCGRWVGRHWQEYKCDILEASGFVRLNMLARECSKARGDAPLSQVFQDIYHMDLKADLVQHSEQMFAEDIPTFLLKVVDLKYSNELSDYGGYFIEMSDNKVQALCVSTWSETVHWLKREHGPWVFTTEFAKIKSCDQNECGSVEWSLGTEKYKIDFDVGNVGSTSIGAYLGTLDEAALLEACYSRYDMNLAIEEESERLRGTIVAALSKEERAVKIGRRGRFWCLG